MKRQISNVCVYKNDPTAFFFEHFDCEKHQKRPNELRRLQYTEVIELALTYIYVHVAVAKISGSGSVSRTYTVAINIKQLIYMTV